jgi:hypothetical protein
MERDASNSGRIRRAFGTLLHLTGCGVLFWLFTVGSYAAPISLTSALGLVTMLSLLTSYEFAIRDVWPGYALGAMIVFIVTIMGGYCIWAYLQPPPPTGPLLAARDPMPGSACRELLQPGDLVMRFATDRVIGRGTGPFAPFAVDSCPVIKLLRKDGGLMVQAVGYDWTNDVAFMVKDNVYEPMEPLQLRVLRPDISTYILLDRFEQEVLYVRYLNRNAVRIRGRFLCGDAPEAVIHDDAILVGGVRIRGVYMGQHRMPGNRCATVEGRAAGIVIGDPALPR